MYLPLLDRSTGCFVCQPFNLKYSEEEEIPGNFHNSLFKKSCHLLKRHLLPFSLSPSPAPQAVCFNLILCIQTAALVCAADLSALAPEDLTKMFLTYF